MKREPDANHPAGVSACTNQSRAGLGLGRLPRWGPGAAGLGTLAGVCLGAACWAVRAARGAAVPPRPLARLAALVLKGIALGLLAWSFSLLAWLALEIA